MKNARAYILLEVAVGGAMVAVVIVSLLGVLADARNRNVYAGRDVIASQLVLEKLEEYRASGGTTACATETLVPNVQGVYARVCTPASAATNVNGVAVTYNEAAVTVTYQTHDGPRTVSGVTRVYQ